MNDDYALIGGTPGTPGAVPINEGRHMHKGTAVKTLGDSSEYPNTEDTLRASMRSEMDTVMGGAHFSLLGFLRSLFRDGIGMLSGVGSAFVGVAFEVVSSIFEFGISLVAGFVGALRSLVQGKPMPPQLPVEYTTAISTDLEAAIGGLLTKSEASSREAELARQVSEAANAELQNALNPEHPDYRLWDLQTQVNEAHEEALAAVGVAAEANRRAIETMQEYVTRIMYCPRGITVTGDHFVTSWSGSTLTLKRRGNWAGTVIMQGRRSVKVADDTVDTWKVSESPIPTATGADVQFSTSSGDVMVTYTVNRGRPVNENTPPGALRALPDGVWTEIASWRVPKRSRVAVEARGQWANKTFGGSYGFQIRLNGKNVTTSSVSSGSPLFGHAPRSVSAVAPHQIMDEGDIVSLWGYAAHGNSLNRQIRDHALYLSWIDTTGDITSGDAA